MGQPYNIGFVLFPDFPLISLASALDVLEGVNRLLDRPAYETFFIGEQTVASSSGLEVLSGCSELQTLKSLVLVSPFQSSVETPDYRWSDFELLGGIAGGSHRLAERHLLDGYRAKVAGDYSELAGRYPQVQLSQKAFELDRNRMTCGAGSAAMDMMLALVRRDHGVDVAARVSEMLVRERLGTALERSDVSSVSPRRRQPQIDEAIELMEANIEEPLGADELASLVGISRRQLERLFRKHLDTVPSKHYLKLRLAQARKLLREDSMPVVEVGIACGFSNASHFSTAYKNHFGLTPREERQ